MNNGNGRGWGDVLELQQERQDKTENTLRISLNDIDDLRSGQVVLDGKFDKLAIKVDKIDDSLVSLNGSIKIVGWIAGVISAPIFVAVAAALYSLIRSVFHF